jgi:hypothetical protein
LILGTSDSGKSTLLKQLKILHGAGFTQKEKEFFKIKIKEGVLFALVKLLGSINEFESRHIPAKYRIITEFYADWRDRRPDEVEQNVIDAIKDAWKEGIIKEMFDSGLHGIPDTTQL